jgi:ABC-type multidrug transport system ATPase subunit
MPEAATTAHAPERGRPPAPAAEPPVLAMADILKSWPSQPTPVLDGVDLALEPGITAAISGRNGAGKTTLLRIAAGLIAAERGSVTVCGLDVDRDRAQFQRRIGFLAAGNSGLYARLKVEHHLEMWSRLAFVPRRERSGVIERAVDEFGLEPLCGRRVDRLSMGQRQRLRLALAFVHGPSLVLLDEPATSLDEEGIALVQTALDELKARGGAALVCIPTGWEHKLGIDRSYVLAGGRLELT